MKLTEFIKQLQTYADEMGSHPKLDDTLLFYLDKDDKYINLELVEIEAQQTAGCRCIYGASIVLKQEDE